MQTCTDYTQHQQLWLKLAKQPHDYTAISAMTDTLSQLSVQQLFSLPQAWLLTLTQAALHDLPGPIHAIGSLLIFMTAKTLRKLHPDTLMYVAILASRDLPQVFEYISLCFPGITSEDLHYFHPETLHHIAKAALLHHPEALNGLTTALQDLRSPEHLLNHPDTLYTMALLARQGHNEPLDAITHILPHISGYQLRSLHPETIATLALAATTSNADILTAICPALGQLSLDDFYAMSPSTLVNLSVFFSSGHRAALNTVLPIFVTDQPAAFIARYYAVMNNLVHLAITHHYYDTIDRFATVFSHIEPHILGHMLALQPQLLDHIVLIAQSGHPEALIALGSAFVQYPPDVHQDLDPDQLFRKCYFSHTERATPTRCLGFFCKPTTVMPSMATSAPPRQSTFSKVIPI